MYIERLQILLGYFKLLSETPEQFKRLDKVAEEIEKELNINRA